MDALADFEQASAGVRKLFASACVLMAVVSLMVVAFRIRGEHSGKREPGIRHPILGKRLVHVGVSPIVLLWIFWLFVGLIPALALCVSMLVAAAPISVVVCTALILWLGPIVFSWILCCVVAMAFWCADVPTLWRLNHGLDGPGDEDVAWRIATLKSDRAVTPLTEALQHDDVRSRRGAAKALGEIVDINADHRGVLPLIEALKDEDCLVRANAAQALGKIQDACALLRNGPGRREIVKALERTVNAHGILPLIEALKDEDTEVRSNAAQTLGKIQNALALLPLIALLSDEETGVRRSAAGALVEIVPVAFALTHALEDPEHEMRRNAAVTALRAALKDLDGNVRKRAADALCWLEK